MGFKGRDLLLVAVVRHKSDVLLLPKVSPYLLYSSGLNGDEYCLVEIELDYFAWTFNLPYLNFLAWKL
ncbi:hypothetical protein D3C87_445710 [compost metagenome]